jgi:hypothetical protein
LKGVGRDGHLKQLLKLTKLRADLRGIPTVSADTEGIFRMLQMLNVSIFLSIYILGIMVLSALFSKTKTVIAILPFAYIVAMLSGAQLVHYMMRKYALRVLPSARAELEKELEAIRERLRNAK